MPSRDLRVATSEADWCPKNNDILVALFVLFLISTLALGGKLFSVGSIVLSAGNLSFPFILVIASMVVEVYGFNKAKRLIFIGFGCIVAFVLFRKGAILLPPAPDWKLQSAFAAINIDALSSNKAGFRTLLATFFAYFSTQFFNAFLITKMKRTLNGKAFLIRLIVASALAETVNSIVFFSIAYIGLQSGSYIFDFMFHDTIYKALHNFVTAPFAAALVWWLKTAEGVEHFDGKRKSDLTPSPV